MMIVADDIEHLKKRKIERPERRRLSVLGQREVEPEGPGALTAEAGDGAPQPAIDPEVLRRRVIDALKSIEDPEIPLNLYDLGLIYGVDIAEGGLVTITMTLTAPACPVAGSIVREVARKVGLVPGVSRAKADVVWDPPWTKDRMSDEAKLALGLL